jgi:hypothetical protein
MEITKWWVVKNIFSNRAMQIRASVAQMKNQKKVAPPKSAKECKLA